MTTKKILLLIGTLHICIFLFAIFSKQFFNIESTPLSVMESTEQIEEESQISELAVSEAFTEDAETISSEEGRSNSEQEELSEENTNTEVSTEITTDEMSEDILSETIVSEPSAVDSSYEYSYTFYYENDTRLNIRETPSMDGRVIGKVLSGTTGIVLTIVDDTWAKIEYDGITGYCIHACLKPIQE